MLRDAAGWPPTILRQACDSFRAQRHAGSLQVAYVHKQTAGVESLFLTPAVCADTCVGLSYVPCTGTAGDHGLHIAAEQQQDAC